MTNTFKKSLLFAIISFFASTVGAASYVPLDVKTINGNTTIYCTDITDAGDPATSWVVVPSYGTSDTKYNNVTDDNNGNPNGLTDNLPTTNGNVKMIQIKADGNTFTSSKRVVIMHVKGITGIIGHGSTTSSGRGMAIGCDEFSASLTAPTEVASVTRKSNSGSFIVAKEGLDKDKEYIVSFYAVSSDTRFYAVEFIAPSGPSADATLSGITYDGKAVSDFSADKLVYDVELPAGTTTPPTVAATATDSKATVNITQATSLPGVATIDVTAEDGTTQKQYKINFSLESGAPKVTSATWSNIRGTASVDNINMTITGQILYGNSLIIAPTFSGKYITTDSWTPSGPQDFSKGSVSYTFTSTADPNEKAVYSVTITEAEPVSSNANLASLSVTGYTLKPAFSPDIVNYSIDVPSGTTTVPTATASAADSKATVKINDASSFSTNTTVVVTAEDGTTVKTYTITFNITLPPTNLTTHEPEIYEAKTVAGGYDGTLTVYNGREYEVYYANRDSEGKKISITTIPGDRKNGIENGDQASSTYAKAKDGWVEVTVSSVSGGTSAKASASEEFAELFDEWRIGNSSLKLHIKGYDGFNYYAADKSTEIDSKTGTFKKKQRFQVFIDGIMQPETQCNTNNTVRHYDISTGEHIIEVKGMDGGDSKLFAFSLRVSDQPRTKHITGNDSTQVIRQTETPKAISYFTKYALKGETKLVWDGPEATGIKLSKQASGELGDTLILSGKALCPVGTYKYAVVATYNGVETNRATGKFSVTTGITALSDTIIDAYQEEQIDEIRFRCYAYEKDSVTIEWKDNNQPEGIQTSFNTSNYIYSITGTPTSPEGIYEYRVGVKGGNSIPGKITIRAISYDNAIMYLYKNNHAQEKDNAYKYLTDELHKNIILRRSDFEAKLRPAEQYDKYDFIFISSDVDANNEEVLDIIRGKINKPVLNMKAFTYAPGRMDSLGWGEPDNGSLDTLTHCGQYIYIQRNDHPIFQKAFSGKKLGDSIKILNNNETRGLMPIKITECPNSLPLATAYTRDINDYFANGPKQTILHEIPVGSELRNGNSNKYICFPLSSSEPDNLTSDGKKLLDAVVDYLLDSNVPSISIPELAITSFTLNGVQGTIDGDSIVVKLNADETDSTYLYSYTLADPVLTHVLPARGDSIDFSFCRFAPVGIVVTDYINRRPYNVIVQFYSLHGIDEVYTAGEWVNIYDIFGRMITTTNQDIYRMDLPHGMYIVVTANGGTLKIMK